MGVLKRSLFVVAALISLQASAWPPTFGVELTFTSEKLIKGSDAVYDPVEDIPWVETDENAAARDKMAAILKKACKRIGCKVSEREDKYDATSWRVTYPDGFFFEVNTDPYVVEIQTKPATLAEFRKYKKRIQRDIFGTAKKAGLYPHWDQGGGHVHIGFKSAFKDDDLLFRNFLVDYMNHVELALGAMDYSIEDSTPFARLRDSQRKAFATVIRDWDEGRIKTPARLAKRIQNEVYGRGIRDRDERLEVARNMALNVNRIVERDTPMKEKTIEIRAVRTHLSAEELIKVLELFQARLTRLAKVNMPIAFVDMKVPSVPARLALFWRYIEDSGLDPTDYAFILPEKWRALFLSLQGERCPKKLGAMGIPVSSRTSPLPPRERGAGRKGSQR